MAGRNCMLLTTDGETLEKVCDDEGEIAAEQWESLTNQRPIRIPGERLLMVRIGLEGRRGESSRHGRAASRTKTNEPPGSDYSMGRRLQRLGRTARQ